MWRLADLEARGGCVGKDQLYEFAFSKAPQLVCELPNAVAPALQEENLDAIDARVAVHHRLYDFDEFVSNLADATLETLGVHESERRVALTVAIRILQLFGHEVAKRRASYLGSTCVGLCLR